MGLRIRLCQAALRQWLPPERPLELLEHRPRRLPVHAEGLLAGDACFEPLEALVVRWSATIPVVSLEVE